MWKQQNSIETTNLVRQLAVTFVITALLCDTALGLSNKRLCADEKCEGIISLGRGLINYSAGEKGMVSFKINSPIRIKSKSAGSDPSLWGIEVNGREGYAPKRVIQETKVYISEKNLKFEVDVPNFGSQVPTVASEPVLSTSEIPVESTTTQPLETIKEGEPIVNSPVDNASNEQPQAATPVQHETIVDGTRLPGLNDNSMDRDTDNKGRKRMPTSSAEDGGEYEDDEDGDIGDYDDDEEDEEELGDTNSVGSNEEAHADVNGTPLSFKEKSVGTSEEVAKGNTYEQVTDTIGKNTDDLVSSSTFFNIPTEAPAIQQDSKMTTEPDSTALNETASAESAEIVEVLIEPEILKATGGSLDGSTMQKGDNSNEETILNSETVPTASVEENLVENNNISTQSSLPDSKISDITSENPSTTNDLGSNNNEEAKPPVDFAQNADSSELPVSLGAKLPSDVTQTVDSSTEKHDITNMNLAVNTSSQIAKETENVSANTNQYSDAPTQSHQQNPVLPDEAVPNPILTENLEDKLPVDAAQTADSFSEQYETTTELPVNSSAQLVEEPDNAQVNTIQNASPLVQPEAVSTMQTTDNSAIDINSQIQHEHSINTQNVHTESAQIETHIPLPHHDQGHDVPESAQQPIETQTPSPHQDHTHANVNQYYSGSHYNPYDYVASSNTPLPPQYDNSNNPSEYDDPSKTPLPTQYESTNSPSDLLQTTDVPHFDYYDQQPSANAPADKEPDATTENPAVTTTTAENPAHVRLTQDPYYDQPSYGQGTVEQIQPLPTTTEAPKQPEEPKALPSLTPSVSGEDLDKKENKGLFATIMDTVNNILPNNKKTKYAGHDKEEHHNELDRILFPDTEATKEKTEENKSFCEKLGPNDCPRAANTHMSEDGECECSLKSLITTEFTLDTFVQALAAKILEISELLAFLAIVAAASLFFIFGYYCFCNSSSEGALLSKLNQLESSLLASHKENAILKHNLMSTRQKLASIEDNSFGSNDMVVSLKKELEEELLEKARLQEQIVNLQKELENAADAGIELNKIVSELLSNQTGDESIISSVEELQKQLNEQQNTILEINASLAEKSRENSELQLLIAEQNARFESQISNLQQDNDELEAEKGNLQTRLEEIKTDFDKDITAALESKNFEIKRLQNEIVDLNAKVEAAHTKWQTSLAKVEALEECLKNVKRDPNVNITQVIDVANIRAELLDAQKKYNTLKERLEVELDARKLMENQLQVSTTEVEKLKQDFNETEKDKLEAQTRLEVLSNYFKDKENQLQKELSLKEAMWLKQQGETTTTVDRLTTMQEEIQSLKSQNDALRAEIEAQVAAHKAQTGTLENRAHETWLAARQSDRRCEEARAEATALRRKLTALAGGNINEVNKPTAGTAGLGDDLANAPSPIHMESPGSPMLGRLPPPPFLPPPFMGPPPPFMGMPPPPPFVPPGEMRPAPLGRIMSPPPPQRSGHIDYDDYLDYEGDNSWHRHHTYSPPPRTYRSLSPTDSRYNYGNERDLISTYDTETDFSPPPSPRESRRRGGGGGYGSDRGGSNSRHPYSNSKKSSSGNKVPLSSGSEKSYNSSPKQSGKSKSSGGGGGKSLV